LSRSFRQTSVAGAEDLLNIGLRQSEMQAYNEQMDVHYEPDPNNSLSESINFTKEHPIGAILIKLAQDNTALAQQKTNLRGVETSIPAFILL
jgi:hypothetical protein